MAHRRGKMGLRGFEAAAHAGAYPPPHLTERRGSATGGWEPPGGGTVLASAIGRELQFSTRAGSTWNASTAHGTQHTTHRTGSLDSPQRFVRMISQGGPNTPENIEPTATNIRIARRALSRNRGRGPGVDLPRLR